MSTTTQGPPVIPSDAPLSPLGQAVYNCISRDRDFGHPYLVHAGDLPAVPDGEYMTRFELDCVTWGLTYGVTYGIARAQDPFEAEDDVLERVLEAAKAAYALYAGDAIFTTVGYLTDRLSRPNAPQEG